MSSGRFDPVTLGAPRFRTLEVGAFIVTEACFPSRLTLPPHVHERAVLGVTLDGEFDSVMLGRTYVCRPGIVHTEPAGERHANHFRPGGSRVVIIQPDPACVDLLQPARPLLESIQSSTCGAAAVLGHRMAGELARGDDWTGLAIEGLAFEVLAVTARSTRRLTVAGPPRWLARVRDRLHDQDRGRLRVVDLAADAGVHPVHLARVFRSHFGTSIGAYARFTRLEWARNAVLRTDRPLAAIAADAGFTDQSHFTRLFRQTYGLTPAAYRREQQRASIDSDA